KIKTWLHWRVNSKAKAGRRGRRSVGLDDFQNLGGNSRRLKDYEMFSRLYYAEKVKPVVKEELVRLSAEGEKLSRGQTLSLIKVKLREVYRNQSEEVKNEVRVKQEEYAKTLGDLKDQDPDDVSNRSATQYLDAIQACPNYLTQIFEPLAKKTGWAFTILCGGPDPMDNGNLAVASVHIGETEAGANFSHVYKPFTSAILDPYSAFLEKVFRTSLVLYYPFPGRGADAEIAKAVRESRSIQNSLIPMKEGNDGVDRESESEDTDTDEEDQLDGEEDKEEVMHNSLQVRQPSIQNGASSICVEEEVQAPGKAAGPESAAITTLNQEDTLSVRAEEAVQAPGNTAEDPKFIAITTLNQNDALSVRAKGEVQAICHSAESEIAAPQSSFPVDETTHGVSSYYAQDNQPSTAKDNAVEFSDPNVNWDVFNEMIMNILGTPADQVPLSGFDPTLALPFDNLPSFPNVDELAVTPGLVLPASGSNGNVPDSATSPHVIAGGAVAHDQSGSVGRNAPPFPSTFVTLQQAAPATPPQVLAPPNHTHAPLHASPLSQTSINLQHATTATVSQ
ncbi:hypothetical protein CVT26_008391, partial [Gymnopilus dilepis]